MHLRQSHWFAHTCNGVEVKKGKGGGSWCLVAACRHQPRKHSSAAPGARFLELPSRGTTSFAVNTAHWRDRERSIVRKNARVSPTTLLKVRASARVQPRINLLIASPTLRTTPTSLWPWVDNIFLQARSCIIIRYKQEIAGRSDTLQLKITSTNLFKRMPAVCKLNRFKNPRSIVCALKKRYIYVCTRCYVKTIDRHKQINRGNINFAL